MSDPQESGSEEQPPENPGRASEEATESEAGPMPEPAAEEPQLLPGGADSIDDPKYGDTPGDPVPRDLDPEDNPAVGEEEVPDEIKELDDKSQEPDTGTSGEKDTPDEPA